MSQQQNGNGTAKKRSTAKKKVAKKAEPGWFENTSWSEIGLVAAGAAALTLAAEKAVEYFSSSN